MSLIDTKGRDVVIDIETAYTAGVQGLGVSTLGNTVGATGTTTGVVVLAASNSISLSQNTDTAGATVWIQLTGGGADGVNIVSLSGNTSGTLTSYSTGTVVLAGGANITLSQSSNSITISGGAGGGGVALSAGTQSVSTGTVAFADANGISFGMTNSNQITASYTVPTQTNQTIGLYASSNTTGQSSSSTYDARTISLRGAGIISVGNSGGEFLISASAAGAADGVNIISLSGNTSGTLTSYTTGTVVLAGGNNITLSQSSNSITISGANVGGAQTGISGIGVSDTTYSSGTVIFSGQNNVTIGSSTNGASQYVRLSVGNYITTGMASDEPHLRAIVYSNATQTSGTLYLSGSNGITISSGANSAIIAFDGHHLDALLPSGNGYGTGFSSMTSGTVGIHATGALSMSQNGNALSLSVPAQTTQPVAASGSNGSFAFSTLTFGISNGVTFYTTNNSIVASHNALTTAAQSNQVVNSLNGSTGQISLATGSSLSSSQNGSTITFGLASNITTALQSAGAYLTTAANSTHSHGNISLALTNLTGTTASASSGMTLSLSAAAPGAGGGIAAQAGTQTATSGTVVWSDSNNVSFGMTNSSVITASATFAQTNQQGSIYASSNTFGTSSGTYDARTLSIAGSGAVSVAASNSGWVVSAPVQTAESQSIGMSTQTAGGGTGGTTGYASGAQVRYHLVPGSNVTMSQSLNGASGTLSIYAAAGGGGAYGFGVSNTGHTAGNTGTYSSATFVLAGSSSLTLSQSTGAASVHTIWLQPAMSQLTAGSGMSLSSGGSTITINMTAQQSIGMSTQTAGGGTGGTTGYASGTGIRYHLVPGSNITMSQSLNGASGTLSIYAPAAGAAAITQSVGISNVTAGGSTGGTSGMVTGDDIQYLFVPGSNITMSQSINGSSGTISIYGASGGGGGGSHYFYDHVYPIVGTTTMSVMGSTSHIQPLHLHNDYSFQWIRFPVSLSAISTTFSVSGGAATFTASNVSTCYVVIYKLGDGASSESLQSVASGSGAFTHLKSMAYQTSSTNTSRTFSISHYWTFPFETGTSSTSQSTTYAGVSFNLVSGPMTVFGTGPKLADLISFNNTLSARAYWIAIGWSSSTGSQSFSAATGARVGLSHVAMTQINSALGFLGQATNSTVQWQKGLGSMTTNAIGTTASYPLSRISSSASYPIMPFQGIAIA